MNFIINLAGKLIALVDLAKNGTVGIIENDFGLIKYILKILRRYLVSLENGYLKFENKSGEVYLHRIILEYYAQFDDKLFTILNNTRDYEINHKNKFKWDNRLENLEFVTKSGNQKHRLDLEYKDEIVMTSEEIIEIKNRLVNQRQYKSDKKYLEKVSAQNIKILSNINSSYINIKIFENAYIRFSNKTNPPTKVTSNTIDINTLIDINKELYIYIKNTFYDKNYLSDRIIKYLNINYNIYRARTICTNNIKLLIKYYKNNATFRKFCNKYNLINHIIKKNKKSKSVLNFNNYDSIREMNQNILKYLYASVNYNLLFSFYKNQLFISVSIKDIICTTGKYNSFRALYYTELLKRQAVPYRKESHTASAFIIPEYTDDLFKSTILPYSKKLYNANLTKITHTIIARNDGLEKAQQIYKNNHLKAKTERDFLTINDIIRVLSSTELKETINKYGFITVADIRKELQYLNEQRKENEEDFYDLLETDDKFITSMIRNIKEIKNIIENDLSAEYTILTNKTKEMIASFQTSNNLQELTTKGLTFNKRIIVLKKLIHKK